MSYYQDPYGPPPDPYSGVPQMGYGMPVARPTNGLAVASMIVSIASLLFCGGIIGPVGAIMGHVSRRQIRERGEGGDGFALAGIIIGWVATVIAIGVIILYVLIIVLAINSEPTYTSTYEPYPYST